MRRLLLAAVVLTGLLLPTAETSANGRRGWYRSPYYGRTYNYGYRPSYGYRPYSYGYRSYRPYYNYGPSYYSPYYPRSGVYIYGPSVRWYW